MMSSENIPPPSQPPDHNQSAASRKPSSSQKTTQEPPQPPPHPLKCPRCDSANTKFCYYNNYSLTQPRHFCKTCRRYWTKGGALRNVPIGGGCRKTKKLKPTSSSLSPSHSYPTPSPSSEFRFLPTPPPGAFEFQLGGLSLPRLHPATAGVYTHFIASSSGSHPHQQPGPPTGSGCFRLDLLGLGNYPSVPNSGNSSSTNSSLSLAGGGGVGGGGGDHTLTISSIESLSTINQEMHWKLQQQRLALIYGPSSSGMEQDDDHNNNQQEKSTLVGGGGGGGGTHLFKNVENAKKLEGVGVGGPTCTPAHHAPTEWLFDPIHANSSSANNYGVTDTNTSTSYNNNNNNNNNNRYEDFNGVWTTELPHHHLHQFNGLQ